MEAIDDASGNAEEIVVIDVHEPLPPQLAAHSIGGARLFPMTNTKVSPAPIVADSGGPPPGQASPRNKESRAVHSDDGTIAVDISVPHGEVVSRYSLLKRHAHELNTQHRLFHRIFTNQRLWHSRLSLFVILLSSTMTLMSSLTFILPRAVIDAKHDRIPNIVLSFLVTIVSSVLKWGAWDTRCEETRGRATLIVDCISKVKGCCIELEKALGLGNEQTRQNDTVLIKESVYRNVDVISGHAVEVLSQTKAVLFSIRPKMVANYEKRILETRMATQNTEVTESFSRLFSKLLDSYQSFTRWGVESGVSDDDRLAADRERELVRFSQLVNDQRRILSTHSHMLQYANDYKRAMFGERGEAKGCYYRFKSLLWRLCCHLRCLEPEDIPLGPADLRPRETSAVLPPAMAPPAIDATTI